MLARHDGFTKEELDFIVNDDIKYRMGREASAGMTDFVLTEHAHEAIAKRKLPIEWIERVLVAPVRTEPDPDDPELTHALGRISEYGNRVLRVVYNDTVSPVRVVTVYFDRRQRNRL